MDFTNFEWPHDTVFWEYPDRVTLMTVLMQLVAKGHVHVVSPRHGQVAMSAAAARQVGVIL